MNKEILYKTDPSGKYSKENYLKDKYNDIYLDIIEYSKINNIQNIEFKEKVYCYKHEILPPKCKNPNCMNNVKYKNSTVGYKDYCSMKCISSDPYIKNIKIKKSIEKFGTKTPSKSQIIKDKIIKTNIERYGSNSSLGNKNIQKKSKNTLMLNYGVEHPSKSKEIQEKRISNFNIVEWRSKFEITMLNNYGVKNALQSDVIKEKMKLTNIERYGVDNPLKSKKIQFERVKNTDYNKITINRLNTINEKYNVDNIMEIDFYKDKARYNRRLKEKEKNINIIHIDLDNNQYLMKCDNGKHHEFKIGFPLYKSRKHFNNKFCTVCFKPNKRTISELEKELLNFIKENYKKTIITNTKKIIFPYELDIYLPELKLAFEFNGIYWHNEQNKLNDYHKIKSDMCGEKEIQLIHIYEDDWINKKDIMKSIILSTLNIYATILQSEECEVKEISFSESINFLKCNYIHVDINSNLNIGLFYNNELVSLLFLNDNEILGYSVKINYNIINGLSKLFTYYINKYNPIYTIIYINRDNSNCLLYNKLGFQLDNIIDSDYSYIVNDIKVSKKYYNKEILINNGYNKDKTEHEIMTERKIYRIYNSGYYKLIYKR